MQKQTAEKGKTKITVYGKTKADCAAKLAKYGIESETTAVAEEASTEEASDESVASEE